ncbi:MAG: hypothetical protein RJB66_1985 [Pseudomonadota bacterium]
MSNTDFFKHFLFFSETREISDLILPMAERASLTPIMAASIEDFWAQWTEAKAFINILATDNLKLFLESQQNQYQANLAPLWLITAQKTTSTNTAWPLFVDEVLFKPIDESTFDVAKSFWSPSTQIFAQTALDQLAKMSTPDLVIKILGSFNASLDQALIQILHHLNERNLKDLSTTCHSLKASAKLVGAQALYNLCQWVEIKERTQSPITEKFANQSRQILIKSQKYFEILNTIPIEKLLTKNPH